LFCYGYCPIDIFFISPEFISSLGLVLDIIGAIIIFKYGLPERIDKKGRNYIHSDGEDKEAIKKAELYDSRSCLGIISLIFGFVLQIISNWL
jgi:hypothetical protein